MLSNYWQGVVAGAEGGGEAVELLEFAVGYGRVIGMVQAVVVVEVAELTPKSLGGGGLVYPPNVPAGWLICQDTF